MTFPIENDVVGALPASSWERPRSAVSIYWPPASRSCIVLGAEVATLKPLLGPEPRSSAGAGAGQDPLQNGRQPRKLIQMNRG